MRRKAIPEALRQQVIRHAGNRCEYCLSRQDLTMATFHIDHIIPGSKGGETKFDNLCFSCPWCNNHKGDKVDVIDPITNAIVQLFHPRQGKWEEHFCWSSDGICLIGLTPKGRATIEVLKLNAPQPTEIRQNWVLFGVHPPI